MRKLIALLLIAALTVLCLPTFAFAAGEDVVTIYHTNDMHAYVESEKDSKGNAKLTLANVAALHKSNNNSLLVDAGDFDLGGANFGQLVNGESVYEAMDAAGYDLGILGNHEFDKSVANFEKLAKTVSFPIISSNISVKAGYEDVSPYLANIQKNIIIEKNGHKLGFFSIDTPTLASGVVDPATLEAGGVVCDTDVPAVSAAMVAELKAKGAEVIIAVTHAGFDPEADAEHAHSLYNAYHVALVEGVDAVIDGHDHVLRLGDTAKKVGDTLVVSTGTQLQALGQLDIAFNEDGTLKSITSTDAFKDALAAGFDPETKAVLDKWSAEVEKTTSQVAFQSEANFYGGNIGGFNAEDKATTTAVARRGYTNAGQLIVDVSQNMAEEWVKERGAEFGIDPSTPVVSYFGGGSVRGSLPKGDVTLGDLMTAYAYSFGTDAADGDNYMLVSPKTLWTMLEHGVNFFQGQNEETGELAANGSTHGRFPQIAGASYVFDLTKQPSSEFDTTSKALPATMGERIQSITLDNGMKLDKNDDTSRILLVVGSYNIGGGDGYWMLGACPDWDGYYSEVKFTQPMAVGWYLIDYVNDVLGGTIPADMYGLTSDRITRVNDPYQGKNFSSKVTLTDEAETPEALADTVVKVSVDGGKEVEYTTDENGVFVIEGLANGAHEVVLTVGNLEKNYYLDNYCGLVNIHAAATVGRENPSTGIVLFKTNKF